METTRGTFNNPIRTFRNLTRMFRNPNCRQEAGSPPAYLPQTMVPVNGNLHRAAIERPRLNRGLCAAVSLILFCVMPWGGLPANAQAISLTTVVVFADHPMQDGQWNAIFTALRIDLRNGGAETKPLDLNADFVRGDRMGPGLVVNSAIAVYLHGDCTLLPASRRTAYGARLGWVWQVDGRIEPFAHVDCTQIANVLGPEAMRLSKAKCAEVMGEAIARVILHEWIHIATQNPAHSETGIARAQFGVADLMGDSRPGFWPRSGQ